MAYGQNVQIVWDDTVGLYKCNVDINWRDNLQKGFPTFMKAVIPHSDRSYEPNTKTWFFFEKWYDKVKGYVELGWPNATTFFYTKQEAQAFNQQQAQGNEQQSYQARFHSTDKYINQFVNISIRCGAANSGFEFAQDYKNWDTCVKVYRKASMLLHPDRNPKGADDMALLNQAWSYIKADKESKQQNV